MDRGFQKCIEFFYRLLLHQNNCGSIWCDLKKPNFEKYKSYERLNSEDMNFVKLRSSVLLAIGQNC